MKNILPIIFLLSKILFAQGPGNPFNPMTANGARHIESFNSQYFYHTLLWQNPSGVDYNKIYFSSDSNLVNNLDPSALILDGQDSSIVFDSLNLQIFGSLELHTKYYWRVVEYNSIGYTTGPIWYFISRCLWYNYWFEYFDSGLSNYEIIQPAGSSWDISYTNNAGGSSPELMLQIFNFSGTAYLILNEYFDLCPVYNPIDLSYSANWQSGQFTIGLANSLDEGITWIPFWQRIVTEDIPATQINNVQVPNENYVKLAYFCTSTISNSSGYCYFDNFILDSPLTVPIPPSQIRAISDTDTLKVSLSWVPGYTVDPLVGYRIQRKNGLPTSSSEYQELANVGSSILTFEDLNVQLDSVYTYRIQCKSGPGGIWTTTWSNEATAYVPEIVPVELISFTADVNDKNVQLNWSTATETNNRGFEIERARINPISEIENPQWTNVGFVNGHGTTTELQFYSFTDESLQPGKYQYRLKQIDFDGNFEFSEVVEVTVQGPTEFSLSQNYPNPFNPSTKIKFTIPASPISFGEGSGVRLIVYDVLGNEVATLVNEEKPAGEYEVEFDGSNLPSGIYFYQLKSGSFIETKKLVLLK